ncbi:hypothetical protein MPER_05610 [Moniliophthora perniciosa FA553]|nr:hypothetical protein MPER_05610 [Moniliophthora perniciosa FA553]
MGGIGNAFRAKRAELGTTNLYGPSSSLLAPPSIPEPEPEPMLPEPMLPEPEPMLPEPEPMLPEPELDLPAKRTRRKPAHFSDKNFISDSSAFKRDLHSLNLPRLPLSKRLLKRPDAETHLCQDRD